MARTRNRNRETTAVPAEEQGAAPEKKAQQPSVILIPGKPTQDTAAELAASWPVRIAAGAVVLLVVGLVGMINWPSMTSRMSVWGPVLVLLGTATLYFAVPFIPTFTHKGWRFRYKMHRDQWRDSNKVAAAWIMHQPLVLITAWGFLGPLAGNMLILLPSTAAIYNMAGLILGPVLGSDKEDTGIWWIRTITIVCLISSLYLIGVNGIYAVQHGGYDPDAIEPRMNAIGPIVGRLGIALPAGASTKKDPTPPFSLVQLEDKDWKTSFDPKTGNFQVRVAPGSPAYLPVVRMSANTKIFSDSPPGPPWFGTSSWKGEVEIYQGGKLVKLDEERAPVYVALVKIKPNGQGGYDREVLRRSDNSPALWDVRPGQSDVLCKRQVWPRGELALCYAVDCDGRGAGWIEFKGAIKMATKNECP